MVYVLTEKADTVDGYHANGLLTALSNSDKGISITVGGTTKSVWWFYYNTDTYCK